MGIRRASSWGIASAIIQIRIPTAIWTNTQTRIPRPRICDLSLSLSLL
jgi:hypothetical protein